MIICRKAVEQELDRYHDTALRGMIQTVDMNLIEKLIDLAIQEDTSTGDITTSTLIPKEHKSIANIIAREEFIFCGGFLIELISKRFGFSLKISDVLDDGLLVKNDQVLAVISGPTSEILTAERTILNFLQRLSGVATRTSQFVKEAPGIHILDTRKTTPGWRSLEKYAVRTGGGENHRMHLGDLILVKNNHIDAHNGDWNSLKRSLDKKPANMPVEVEVRDTEELENTLSLLSPNMIMLDNMNDDDVKRCIQVIRKYSKDIKIEVSGGITKERLKFLSTLGDIYVSVGSLTTKAVNVDISLRINK